MQSRAGLERGTSSNASFTARRSTSDLHSSVEIGIWAIVFTATRARASGTGTRLAVAHIEIGGTRSRSTTTPRGPLSGLTAATSPNHGPAIASTADGISARIGFASRVNVYWLVAVERLSSVRSTS